MKRPRIIAAALLAASPAFAQAIAPQTLEAPAANGVLQGGAEGVTKPDKNADPLGNAAKGAGTGAVQGAATGALQGAVGGSAAGPQGAAAGAGIGAATGAAQGGAAGTAKGVTSGMRSRGDD